MGAMYLSRAVLVVKTQKVNLVCIKLSADQ